MCASFCHPYLAATISYTSDSSVMFLMVPISFPPLLFLTDNIRFLFFRDNIIRFSYRKEIF